MAELLVVLLIVALLAAIAVPSVSGSIQRARETALRENLQVMRRALDDYFADTAAYPASLDVLVEERYIRFVPDDPIAGGEAEWATDIDAAGRIMNVRSTSDALASDETRYSEW